jgi:hypothetical protein
LIFGRVLDIPKRFANYCDDRRFVDRKFSRRANVQGEPRSRPTENGFANFTPRRFRFARHFTDDNSRLASSRVCQLNVQIAVYFKLHSDNAASKSESLVFDAGTR